MNVKDVNLNLLVSLDAILREKSVTGAARSLGVTQSTMSAALAQLRVVFDDPLFVRSSRGMTPTPRALALEIPVREGLSRLDQALKARRPFDPESSTRTFVVAATDYVELVLLPNLLAVLARTAPSVRIDVRPIAEGDVPEELASGAIDLAIGTFEGLGARHASQPLFEESYVCVVRRGHPTVRRELTLRRYLELEHVSLARIGSRGSNVDRALSRLGRTRRVGARPSHYLLVPPLVASTDMVAALSRRVADLFAPSFSLRVLPPPIKLPKARISQAWHEISANDPACIWLRRLIATLARRI